MNKLNHFRLKSSKVKVNRRLAGVEVAFAVPAIQLWVP